MLFAGVDGCLHFARYMSGPNPGKITVYRALGGWYPGNEVRSVTNTTADWTFEQFPLVRDEQPGRALISHEVRESVFDPHFKYYLYWLFWPIKVHCHFFSNLNFHPLHCTILDTERKPLVSSSSAKRLEKGNRRLSTLYVHSGVLLLFRECIRQSCNPHCWVEKFQSRMFLLFHRW